MFCFSGRYRPGDRTAIPGFAQVLKEGKAYFQIGDNSNLFDWTYVGNVAYAHILAAEKLIPTSISDDDDDSSSSVLNPEKEDALLNYALPPIDVTTGKHRIPTSDARPLGPYVEPPPDAESLLAAFNDPHRIEERPVVRSRFDPLSKSSIERAERYPLQVAGQVFFITNGEPLPFWDFPRALWRLMAPGEYPSRGNIVLPKTVGLVVATLSEWWGWLVGKEPTFTRFKVTYTCAIRYYNIEKARRLLGYEPQVGLEEGIKRTIDVRFLLSTFLFSSGIWMYDNTDAF